MDQYKGVETINSTQFDVGTKVNTNSVSESGIYTDEMSWMRSKINLEAPTSDANKIN